MEGGRSEMSKPSWMTKEETRIQTTSKHIHHGQAKPKEKNV